MRKKVIFGGVSIAILTATMWFAGVLGQDTAKAADVTEPVFSKESGSYDSEFSLKMSAPEGSTIYYTTDGSVPLSKEDEAAVSTSTPVPTPTKAPVNIDISKSNTDYVYDVGMTEESDGIRLDFAWRYRSMCFKVPDTEVDWTKYTKIVVDYSVEQANNGASVGLQACPIYAGSPDSYGDDGEYRVFEARTSGELGLEHEKWEINLLGKDVQNVGWFMIGTTTNVGRTEPTDVIKIHSIQLVSGDTGGDPTEKKDTQTYKAPITVKNRAGEDNVLSAKDNAKLMYNTGYTALYAPKNDEVAKATVIRAIAVDKSGQRSKVVTKTYFVGNNISTTYKNASVISVVTDPDNLLSKKTGIYRTENYENSGKDWERQAFVEYFDENGTIPFATEMGIRIHGGYSRHYGQKSFNLYFRDEYGGLNNLKNYQLIPGSTNFDKTKATTKYKNFMLRNGGNDTEYTKMQDVWIQSLVNDRAYTTQGARPCVLFLNGEYWGLYNLTEKYSDNYLEEKFGVKKSNVVMIKDNELDEGEDADLDLYKELQSMADLDMTNEANYKKFCDAVDLQSYLDYYATEIFIGNYDWPENNTQLWRTRTNDGTKYGDTKWRWMLYDTEYSMNQYGDSTGSYPIQWALNHDVLFAAVYENTSFKTQFIKTMCDLLNTNFAPEHMTKSLEEYTELYRPLMEDYFVRFGLDKDEFNINIARMKKFAQNRSVVMMTTMKALMKAGASTKLTIKSNAAKKIKVNTSQAELTAGEFCGSYFKKYTMTIQAPEVEGYRFDGWKLQNATAKDAASAITEVTLGDKPVITANYVKLVTEPTASPVPTAAPTPSISPKPSPTPEVKVKKPGKVKSVKVKLAKKHSFRVSWRKMKDVSGYQIMIARNNKFTKAKKVYQSKNMKYTCRKLSKGKKYFVKVCAYRKNTAGKKVYGSYSSVVTTKKVK